MSKKNQIVSINPIYKILILIASSFIFMLANPNFIFNSGLGFLGWFVYVPVLLLIKISDIKTVWIYGFFYGLLSYFLFAFWVKDYHIILLLILCGFYAIVFAIVFLLLKLCDYIFKSNGWILQWVVLCIYEYAKTLGFSGINYGVTAYTQWQYLPIIQICDVTGVFGLNSIIILFSVIIYSFIGKKIERKIVLEKLLQGQEKTKVKSHINYATQKNLILKQSSIKNPFIVGCILLIFILIILIYGFYKINKNDYSSYNKITVAAIQNNVDSKKSGVEQYGLQIHKLMTLTEEARDFNPNIQMVVWPETAVVPAVMYHYTEKVDLTRYTIVKSVLDYINLSDSVFVIGNGHYGELEGKYHKRYNSALVFEGKKNTIPPDPEIYIKQHLVPFSEYFPYSEKFPKLTKMLLNGEQTFWTPGNQCKVFNYKGLSFSTPICFEDSFASITRQMYSEGSRCFVNLTNDSWANSKACQNQHLAMSVFRSVENRVPSVRSATSGETCVIYPDGKIIARAPSFCESYVISEIPIIPQNVKPTIYNKYGDICGFGMIFLLFLLLLIKLIIVIIRQIKLHLKYH